MLTINLNSNSSIPLYEQIYSYIKEEIKSGNLECGSKLPSTRNLATHLQVSRNTIDMAYGQLQSEGYIEAYEKKGYFINSITNLSHPLPSDKLDTLPQPTPSPKYQYDFSPFAIDISNFPYHTWKRLTKNSLNHAENNLFLLGDNQGDLPLRKEIQKYLRESRGVNCTSEQIIIGAGTDYLLQLLIQILDSSKVIGMENPTYKKAYQIFTGFQYQVIPISLDANGICVKELYKSDADLSYVTPSHQYPLGIIMPINRRMELLKWAELSEKHYIIEDDHDSEFRYKGKPIPALQGLDHNGKVIYLGTFSRSIAPAIRIGYMVLPNNLLEKYKNQYSYYSSTVSRIDQAIITNFLEEGYFERHLNRMRKIYKNKHDLFLQGLKPLKGKIEILGEHGGLHLVLKINTAFTENEIIQMADLQNIKISGLEKYYIKVPKQPSLPHILLGYANLSEEEIAEGTKKLCEFISGL